MTNWTGSRCCDSLALVPERGEFIEFAKALISFAELAKP